MEILNYSDIDLSQTIKRSEEDVNNVLDTVSDILNNVKVNKDNAIREYTEKFDGVTIENLKVSKDEIDEAYDTLDDELLAAQVIVRAAEASQLRTVRAARLMFHSMVPTKPTTPSKPASIHTCI